MELKHQEVEALLSQLGWTPVQLAHKLGLTYSHVYRILNNQRKVGLKFVSKFLQLCDKQGWDYHKYFTFS